VTAQGQREESNDPDLVEIADAWPMLAAPVKAGILALIRASRKISGE
jgi:hypothetical protein